LASLNNEIPSVPSGFFGKLGATAGSFAQALAEPTMTGIGLYATGGTIGAPALGTEAAFAAAKGLQSVGDVVGWMNEIGNDSYEPTWDKVYNGNLKNIENPTYQQKIDAANKATEAASYAKSVGALEGMFFGIPLGSLGSSIKPSVTGYLNTLKSIGRSSLAQMPQMTGASFLGQVGKGEVGRQFGSNETHSQIIQQGLENAWETAKFVGGMGFVHAAQASIPHAFALLTNPAESPSKALTAKAKSIVTKFPEEVVADVYAKAEQEGVIPPGKANEIIVDLQNYKESEAQVPKTVVDVDAKDAIAGKIQKRDKLDQELKETKVNARKEEIKQEIAQIDAEIDNIYKGDDVLANEYDINGIPLNQDLPAPKQRPSIIPLENVEAVPAEKLLTEEVKPTGIKAEVKPTEVKAEVKPTEVEVTEEVKPIRQLGTGSNVYFENNKYRVNDISKGKVILNIEGKEEGGMAIANIEFNNPKEAVEVAKELSKIYPKGIPDAVLIDKVVDNIRNRIKEGIKTEVKPTEVKSEIEPAEVEKTKKIIEEEAQKNPEKIANATSKIFKDAGYHRGVLPEKSDYISNGYKGELPYTGYYFVSNPKDVVQGGSRFKDSKAFRIVDFSKYNLFKPEDANAYFGTNRGLKKLANDLENGINPKEALEDLLKNNNVSYVLKNKIKEFNSAENPQENLQINRKIYKLEQLLYEAKNNKEFDEINNEINLLNKQLQSTKKESFTNNLYIVLQEYKNERKSKDFSERLETKILKSLGYEGVDVRGIKAEGGLKSPDDFSHGSVIFDLKPETVTTTHEAYLNALKIPEEKRSEKQKDLIKSVDEIVKKPELKSLKEVKPTEVKVEVKPSEVKKEVFKSSQGNTVELENGKLVVKSKSGEVLSERASKKAIEEYAENFDYSKGDKAPDVPSEITNSRDAARYVIEESKNPTEIAEIYASEDLLPKESNPKFQAIAEYGLGRIKTSSYKNLGDPNKIEKSMYLKIFSEERGTPIDVLAKSISDKYEGLNIEPQDIVDYIERYSRGDKSALEFKESDVALQAADKFNKLTGLDLNSELANKIIDNKLGKANKDQLEIIKEDYETAKQLEDAYWAEYKKTDGFTKESNIGEVDRPEAAQKPEKSLEKAYKDLTNIEKRQIINSKFDKLLEELKIEKICPTD
jgi:hypothetical protein